MDISKEDNKKIVIDRLEKFQKWVVAEEKLNPAIVAEKTHRLKAEIWKAQYNEEIDGFDYSQTDPFTYDKFWLEEEPDPSSSDAKKKRRNLVDLWSQYIDLLLIEDPSLSIGKIGPTPKVPLSIGPAPVTPPHPSITATTIPPHPVVMGFEPTRWLSSSAVGLIGGAGFSMLLGSTSKLVLCTTLGVIGFPLAGIVAGVGSGILVSAFKNRAKIGEEMSNTTGFVGKTGALFVGIGKSINGKQLFFNALFGAVGGFGAGVALSLLDDPTCVVDAVHDFTDAIGYTDFDGMEALQADHAQLVTNHNMLVTETDGLKTEVGGLKSAVEAQQATIEAQQTTIDGQKATIESQGATIENQETEMKALEERIEALEKSEPAPVSAAALAITSAQTDIIECPAYISDCPPDRMIDVSDTIDSYKEIIVENDEGVNAVIAGIETPLDSDPVMMKPDHATVKIESGDTLTDIIETEYNIEEGSEKFDAVMAEVARVNGLEGNEQNWLKVNWNLQMPELDPANLNGELDRASLDANWRSGDVVYSDAPKLAA